MTTAHVDDSGDCVVYRDGIEVARLGIVSNGMFSLALAILQADLAAHCGDMPPDEVARLAGRMVEAWGREQAWQHIPRSAQRAIP